MGVVQLHEDFVGEDLPGIAVRLEPPQDVLDGAGDEEVLLLEPEFLALEYVIVRVKHLGEVLGQDLVLHRFDVTAAVEIIQVKLLGRLGRPKPQRVDRPPAIPDNGQVVGHADHGLGVHPMPL